MKLGTERIGGRDGPRIEIEVDALGVFSAEVDEVEYTGKTKDELIEKLKKAVRRQARMTPVEITILDFDPAIRDRPRYNRTREETEEGRHTHATLRGQNPRTRELLLTIDGKKSAEYSLDDQITRRLSDAEVAEFQRLKVAIAAAEAAYAEWLKGVSFDVKGWLAKKEKAEEAE